MTNTSLVCRQALGIVCVLLLTGAFLAAQEPAPAQASAPAQPMSPERMDTLVAPIALYPDALLSQVLVAATYPLEVVEAAQWLQQNRTMLFTSAAQAMEIRQFDKMADADQKEFIVELIQGAEKVLTDAGRADQAAQVSHLFTTNDPGDQISTGMTGVYKESGACHRCKGC